MAAPTPPMMSHCDAPDVVVVFGLPLTAPRIEPAVPPNEVRVPVNPVRKFVLPPLLSAVIAFPFESTGVKSPVFV